MRSVGRSSTTSHRNLFALSAWGDLILGIFPFLQPGKCQFSLVARDQYSVSSSPPSRFYASFHLLYPFSRKENMKYLTKTLNSFTALLVQGMIRAAWIPLSPPLHLLARLA